MKKAIFSGLGLMIVALMAMPAGAEKGSRIRGDGYKADKQSQFRHFDKKNDNGHRAFKKNLNREWREYQKDRKQNIRAMKRSDSPRERKRIHRNMIADWRDYKHDVSKIKRHYQQKKHYRHRPVYKHHKKGYVTRHHNYHKPKYSPNYLAFGLWF